MEFLEALAKLQEILVPFAVYVFFVSGYALLTAGIAMVLWVQRLLRTLSHPNLETLAATPGHKWVLVVLLAALAGLPPFFFFFCKLNIFTYLLGCGHVGSVGALGAATLISWYAYYVGLSKVLAERKDPQPSSPLDNSAQAALSLLANSLVCLTLLSVLFTEDFTSAAFWASSK